VVAASGEDEGLGETSAETSDRAVGAISTTNAIDITTRGTHVIAMCIDLGAGRGNRCGGNETRERSAILRDGTVMTGASSDGTRNLGAMIPTKVQVQQASSLA
jgi:hypothetical protein